MARVIPPTTAAQEAAVQETDPCTIFLLRNIAIRPELRDDPQRLADLREMYMRDPRAAEDNLKHVIKLLKDAEEWLCVIQ